MFSFRRYSSPRRSYYDRRSRPSSSKRARDWNEGKYNARMPAKRSVVEVSEISTKSRASPSLISDKHSSVKQVRLLLSFLSIARIFHLFQDFSISDERVVKRYDEHKREQRQHERYTEPTRHKDERR